MSRQWPSVRVGRYIQASPVCKLCNFQFARRHSEKDENALRSW